LSRARSRTPKPRATGSISAISPMTLNSSIPHCATRAGDRQPRLGLVGGGRLNLRKEGRRPAVTGVARSGDRPQLEVPRKVQLFGQLRSQVQLANERNKWDGVVGEKALGVASPADRVDEVDLVDEVDAARTHPGSDGGWCQVILCTGGS
jgi:hypothetical protein